MAAGHLAGFLYFSIHRLIVVYQIQKKTHQFRESSYNAMKVIINLKIEDGGRPPCLIFILATYSLNRGISNTDEIKTNLATLAAT